MRPVVVTALDADVLVPIVACDFILTAFDHGLIEPVVSVVALAEVERGLIEDLPHLGPDVIAHRVGSMRTVLEDPIFDTSSAGGVPDAINVKDHVVQAALAAEADLIVTNDAPLRSEVAASGLAGDEVPQARRPCTQRW